MDYCAGGEFFRMLKSQPERRIPEEWVRFYAAEVLLALGEAHPAFSLSHPAPICKFFYSILFRFHSRRDANTKLGQMDLFSSCCRVPAYLWLHLQRFEARKYSSP